MNKFVIGQRWISETEPELGLGSVLKIENRSICIRFPAGDVIRRYAALSAPVTRVAFRIGDQVKSRSGNRIMVKSIKENKGLLIYCGEKEELPESDLCDQISFSFPEDRMRLGQTDQNRNFDLRYRTMNMQYEMKKSSVRGFVGGRVDLIPHQFNIADETVSRRAPRVLLSDETGLGKTIEACLVLHHQLITGRAERALIVLPESLIHQWFVELLRRFNLMFRICDERYCESIEKSDPGVNPFLENQLYICSIDFLISGQKRFRQVVAAGWDMLIVDEAHRVKENTSHYQLIQALARHTRGMMLLTATPEQLGLESHFARLHLLDPDRYFDLNTFLHENGQYNQIARIAGVLLDPEKLRSMDEAKWAELLSGQPVQIKKLLQPVIKGDHKSIRRCIDALIDRYGIGRVMFRNTRDSIKGFPDRVAHLVGLEYTGRNRESYLDLLTAEFVDDNLSEKTAICYDFHSDPRIIWLAGLLQKLKHEKILLICRNIDKAVAIESAIQKHITIKSALFHEQLSLVHRDRNAAWFSEPDGAQLLISSEIGSEGRNFQFAHHLVLFDLPLDPDLLEQRIGRLDRIGQASTIHIHIPYISGSVQEILARWYHDGLNAIETNITGVGQIADKFRLALIELAAGYRTKPDEAELALNRLIAETIQYRGQITKKLKRGRDRLLELSSFRPQKAHQLVQTISRLDKDRRLDEFMLEMFDHFGIEAEELADRTFLLIPGLRFNDAFPGFRDDKMTVTFDRSRALEREDMVFLSWDHPMVTGAMELMLGLQDGNSVCAVWHSPDDSAMLLESVFVLECVAPLWLHADRFLPPVPIRVVVDHRLEDITADCPFERMSQCLEDGFPAHLFDNSRVFQSLLPEMIEKSRKIAQKKVSEKLAAGLMEVRCVLEDEILRLSELKAVNKNITQDEIDAFIQEKDLMNKSISEARLRLDSLRLIWKGEE
ncbi:MAG: RNA polymerase-associated protein RapA [Desulfobacterales bacterium]|nr:RNA polymerase-associated protein RapA [Desulfobacterales bacterium]MDD4072974.1 RNA polymerase-associated protein RapA [Desulfobacterales bacterium]MDD4393646.1 RNA polymerase-associated protein RapA [Desulfobacterales bacterium]